MDLDFSKEQDMLRKSVAEFLAKECPFDIVREIEDSAEGFDKKMWKKMAKLGWMEIHFPEEYGGLGDPFVDVTIIMEEMGKKAFPSPFFSTVILCSEVLLRGGSEAQKEALLPKIVAGKKIMALAQYEEEASYLESGIQLAAELQGDDYLLNGKKMFVLDANIANDIIVAARTADGVTLFLVDSKAPGVSIEKMHTIGKDNNCVVLLDNVVHLLDVEEGIAVQVGRPGEVREIAREVRGIVRLGRPILDHRKHEAQRDERGAEEQEDRGRHPSPPSSAYTAKATVPRKATRATSRATSR